MSDSRSPAVANRSAALADLIDRLTTRVQAGEPLDADAVAAEYPAFADDLRKLLPAVGLLGELSRSREAVAAAPLDERIEALGDYRIVREVGRGGMGVVYEAEQLSLRRRVALKVLPFAAVMDPRSLQRFKNEALAAAGLDHPHVVRVYGVGCERGVHFIAMQFVDGQTLADLIRERRGAVPGTTAGGQDATRTYAQDATATYAPGRKSGGRAGPPTPSSPPRGDSAYYRQAAEWGVQAADALEHAHGLGVVHRDVKPGNLLVDGSGKVSVADFGLAKRAADPGVTGTGDLLGTIRYMSPEQAGAKHDLVDHRSDIYSLGVTLYELLALVPAFAGADRQAVLSAVLTSDPAALRSHNRGIPRDLETVVRKAMDKDPARRYQSAADLAADLRRFLAHQPVVARPPSAADRLGKWGRRHRVLVGAGVTALAVVAAATTAAAVVVGRENAAKEQALTEKSDALAEKDAALVRADANFLKALDGTGAVARAVGPYRRDLPAEVLAVRAAVLGRAKEFFVAFLDRNRADAALRRETLIALGYLSEVLEGQNDLIPAAESLAKALELAEGLKAEFTTDARFQADFAALQKRVAQLSLSLNDTAVQAHTDSRFAQAEEFARAAFRLVERWGNADPTADDIIKAVFLRTLSDSLEAAYRLDDAAACLRTAAACVDKKAWAVPAFALVAGDLRFQIHGHLTRVLMQRGELTEVERLVRDDLKLLDEPNPGGMPRFLQPDAGYRGASLARRADVLRAQGKTAESDRTAKEALKSLGPNSTERVWLLLLASDPAVRDPKAAAINATALFKAAQAAPRSGWEPRATATTVLGVARLQLEDWNGAIESLEAAHRVRPGGIRGTLFYLALAHARAGNAGEAKRWYAEAVRLMDSHQPKDPELLSLRKAVGPVIDALAPRRGR